MRVETKHSQPTKLRLGAEVILVLAVIFLPVVLLGMAGERVPVAVVQLASLLILPVTAVVCWLLVRAEGPGLAGLGLRRPEHWAKSIGWGVLAGVGIIVVSRVAILPVVIALFGSYIDPAALDPLKGNAGVLMTNVFLVSWLHAALCEEIIFRGFLLQRFERALGAGTVGLAVAIVLQAILFGVVHYPQGTTGIVAVAVGGILWGAIFLAARRNLWVVIVGHAVVDTTVFVLVFFGLHRLVITG